MKNKILYVIFAVAVIFYLSSILYQSNNNPKITENNNTIIKNKNTNNKNITINNTNTNSTTNISSIISVTRAVAAKMIALAFYDYNEILTKDREIKFEDSSPDKWYDKYVNIVTVEKLMDTKENLFEPYKFLTKKEAKQIFENITREYNKIDLTMLEENKNDFITSQEWTKLYMNFINANKESIKGIKKETLIIVATPMNCKQLSSWKMASNKGIYDFSGFTVDKLIDKKVSFLVKNNNIIALLNKVEDQPILKNAYAVNVDEHTLTIFVGGVNRQYDLNIKTDVKKGNIVDIKINNGNIKEIITKSKIIKGKIMRIDENYVELDNEIYNMTDSFKIYSNIDNNIGWKDLSNLLVGSDVAEFVFENDKICAAVITKKVILNDIRVVLHTTGFKSLIHNKVSITSDNDFYVKYGKEKKIFKKNQVLNVSNSDNSNLFGQNRIYINPADKNGRIIIKSIVRGTGETKKFPQYRGTIEIAKQGKGYSVVNELNIEDYLYAVVPSEMPSYYGVESSKVQAITARSYAYIQMYKNRYHKYGAHIDDSTACQVYNNSPENDISIQAVNETKGLGLTYNGKVISANYFSTSCGYTANSGEVWANYLTQQFPCETPRYLKAKKQFEGNEYKDLSKEEIFYHFIKDNSINAYDKKFGWFRWNVTMNREEIEASINNNLEDIYKAKPKLVRTLDKNNIFRSRKVEGIGKLKDLYTYKRGKGGNIMEMVIIGTNKTVKVVSEYNIRKIIRPVQYLNGGENIILTRLDGKQYINYSLMPSAFYAMEKVKDAKGNLLTVKFIGGGYGHGVGMSQNGVKGMVDKGYNYEQILKHFYEGIEIKKIL